MICRSILVIISCILKCMNIYFAGIGGVGIGPLANIALDAGYSVQGSDKNDSPITRELRGRGVVITVGEDTSLFLAACHEAQPIDLLVHTAALPPDHPELALARSLGIPTAKRDELLARIISEKNLKLIAIAGSHGKTTTTGMMVWALKQLGVPVSYSVGTTLSFGPSGTYQPGSEYFVYECDEFDRNFLRFSPYLSLVTSVDYDHPDTYPTKQSYQEAFEQFAGQSSQVIGWKENSLPVTYPQKSWVLDENEVFNIALPGNHNRRNATLVAKALEYLQLGDQPSALAALANFPGTNRRFEMLAGGLYSDYGHHPTEIAATLQMARELSEHVVLIYQPHQNIRQHEIKNQYTDCFENAEKIYWLPTYLSREDPNLPILTPEELTQNISNKAVSLAEMDDALWDEIQRSRDDGRLVLCMGAGTIDSWVREQIGKLTIVNALVVDTQGNFVMQKRDNKPGISNPNMVTGFGGHLDSTDKTLRDGIARELREETNLKFSNAELRYFKTYHKQPDIHGEDSYVTYFILPNVSTEGLEVYEGQGFEIVSPDDDFDTILLSPLVRQVLEEFTARSSAEAPSQN